MPKLTTQQQAEAYLRSRPLGATQWIKLADKAIAKSIREGLVIWDPTNDTITITPKGRLARSNSLN